MLEYALTKKRESKKMKGIPFRSVLVSVATSCSVATAALRLKLSYPQVMRLVFTGALRGWQEGRNWRVDESDVVGMEKQAEGGAKSARRQRRAPKAAASA